MDEHDKTALKDAVEASGVKSLKDMWQHKLDHSREEDKHNPFSHTFDGHRELPDQDHYGRPPEGSLTELRGQQAAAWVDKEVDRLVDEIKKIGRFDPSEGGVTTTTFGELFTHYQDISNTVVGILMRAKKRHRVKYEGEMLFQHSSKEVKITVL